MMEDFLLLKIKDNFGHAVLESFY